MDQTCFYCDEDLTQKRTHYISFFHENQEREETMCEYCYSEWLQGIKG
ncbi:hypothetical protein ACP2W0_09735 [Pseudobacillus badius]|uniref:Small CPxCG-related zinc finger protein n=1 Tax=Bacillus badius TaxID=1455 RepID=A0ABR5AWE5_BACBA|nr:hypothetical protein SD78_1664 [Bacillus badius]KIL79060.1 hypothetical protein SD77_3861 [Bacillus badius]MED0666608.1 hypothetical protein [Bacillus badius]